MRIRVRTEGKAGARPARRLPRARRPAGAQQTEKHSIDVVVDRIKVAPAIKQRLAESFETALRLADGARVAHRWTTAARSRSSPASSPARSATGRCASSSRACSPSTTRWAPARNATASAWSSSSTRRASSQFPNLSLGPARCAGWDRRNQFYFQMLPSLSLHYDFDIEKPFEELPERCATSSCSARAARRSRSST